MVRFVFHMMRADIKRTLRGSRFFVLPLIAALIIVLPFTVDYQMSSTAYFVVCAAMLLSPLFSRVYYVLPLSIKQIRRFFFYRIFLFDAIIVSSGLLVVLICELAGWRWNRVGILHLLWFMMIHMISSLEMSRGFLKKIHWTIWTIIVVVGICSCLLLFMDEGSVTAMLWKCAASVFCMLFILGMLFALTRKMEFRDYVYQSNWIGANQEAREKP